MRIDRRSVSARAADHSDLAGSIAFVGCSTSYRSNRNTLSFDHKHCFVLHACVSPRCPAPTASASSALHHSSQATVRPSIAAMASAYVNPQDMGSLREYVTGKSGMQQADSTVLMHIAHNHLKARFPEIRLDMHMTVGAVKAKINTHTGTSPDSMQLALKDENGRLVAALDDDSRKLGFYSPRNGWTLQVTDTDGSSLSAQGWLDDVSKVQKYMISDEDYDRRENTYRKYKAGKVAADPGWTLEKELAIRAGREYVAPEAKAAPEDDFGEAEAAALEVGARCCVDPGERRGEIRYVGRVEGLAPGYWVGVALDEPCGRNDGSVKGRRVFECAAGHGALVRPDKVAAGDFPPLDDFSDLGSGDEI
ncbi:MAG: CAP Gly-rich domain-containing protein [Monoraphidium minutum]|nr:MAG: CAP Gly-rich domain-containing protein [Monoraphidium minutum]